MTGLLALAFGAGLVSAVNPCGFAVLPAWLAYHLDATSSAGHVTWAGRLRAGLVTGLALVAGYLGTIAVVSLLITAGAHAVLRVAPQVAILVGVLLAVAGLALIAGRQLALRLPPAVSRLTLRSPGSGRLFGLGAGYALASLGCSIGILVAIIAEAVSTASLAGLLAVLGAYALGAAALLLLLTTSTAFASGWLVRALRRGMPLLHRITGVIMLAAGAYVVAYWWPVAQGGIPGQRLPDLGPVAGEVALWITSNQLLVAVAALLVVAAAVAVALLGRPSPERVAPGARGDDGAGGCRTPDAGC